MYELRDYQETALTELYDWLKRHDDGNPVVDASVGAGKSIIIAEFCRRAIEQYPQTRIVMCVASKELCQQNLEKLRAVWPEAPVGICSASLGSKDTESQIIFATIGSIVRLAPQLGVINLLVIDECHNVNTDNAGMYRQLINDLKKYGSPYLCTIGFTGTPYRGDGIWLWQGSDPLFAGSAARISMTDLLEQGYLSPLVADTSTPETIDSSNINVARGDYVIKELEAAALDAKLIEKTISDMATRGKYRNKWLIFCVTIDHAQAVLNELQRTLGALNAKMVTGKTGKKERATTLKQFKLPKDHPEAVNCLVNVACLTTGFDAPETDLIALLRPTKSPVLYVQIAGRGMRIADGKQDCLWLDYTSTTRTLGPINLIKGRNKPEERDDDEPKAPVKYCPACGNPNPIRVEECMECGEPLPIEVEDPHGAKADQALPLHGFQAEQATYFDVIEVAYSKHFKSGKPPSLRIDYVYSKLEDPISEWKCIELDGYALRMARAWWATHMPHSPVMPATVDEALQVIHDPSLGAMKLPTRVHCRFNSEYKRWNVASYEYDTSPQAPKVVSYKPFSNQEEANFLIPF